MKNLEFEKRFFEPNLIELAKENSKKEWEEFCEKKQNIESSEIEQGD